MTRAAPSRSILLSFDVEEFDIPQEYGQPVSDDLQLDVGSQGLESILALLDALKLRATLFTTAHFAHRRPELILRAIAAGHEIASHGFFHSSFEPGDLQRSRSAIERVTGSPVTGFRMPRLAPTDPVAVRAAGYTYNSSENPTWIPGRYNHFLRPRTARLENGLLQLPISVTPLVRFPLFWLSFKNFPLPAIKLASDATLRTDGYLNIFYHPWEFTDLRSYRLPGVVRRIDGQRLLDRLADYIGWLAKRGTFETIGQFDARFRAAQDGTRGSKGVAAHC
ncbi:MAG: polysaccharide deacetylase family protein [Planctomycetota bacterium]|nr:polysaccharide deacetylase family protein [Planctomycetota bacterium]